MDPNVSAPDEENSIFGNLRELLSNEDTICIASMLTDEQQPMLTDEQPTLTDEQMSIITSLDSMLTNDDDDDDDDDDSLVSKHADSSPTPQDPADRGAQNNILNPRVEDRNYTKFTREEVEKLIGGVEQYGRRWAIIQRNYFSGSTRTTQKLKDKWRHMLGTTVTDPRWPELYVRAKEVDARYPKDARSASFRNTNNNN